MKWVKDNRRVVWFYIFLSAMRAESFFNLMSAVQAGFIFSDFSVAHDFIVFSQI
jgi:hypothetical protein